MRPPHVVPYLRQGTVHNKCIRCDPLGVGVLIILFCESIMAYSKMDRIGEGGGGGLCICAALLSLVLIYFNLVFGCPPRASF